MNELSFDEYKQQRQIIDKLISEFPSDLYTSIRDAMIESFEYGLFCGIKVPEGGSLGKIIHNY